MKKGEIWKTTVGIGLLSGKGHVAKVKTIVTLLENSQNGCETIKVRTNSGDIVQIQKSQLEEKVE